MIKHEEVVRELARRKFSYYLEVAHGGRYKHGNFTRYISNKVQEFIETDNGNAYDILCLSVPPQHGKSMTITESLPSWLVGKYPDKRVILVSYNDDFAKLFLRRNREKLDEYGENIFGIEVGHPDTANEFEIDGHAGGIISRGILSGITGRPADYIIIDDPIKNREEADSENQRAKIYDEWLHSVKSRLAPNAKIIVIQTRWHQQDLIGMMIENEPNARYINFPVICETESDVLGRKFGQALCPELGRDEKWWENFSLSYQNSDGSRAMNALYYGRPSNDEGGIFKRKWFENNMYDILPPIAYKVISIDATFKDTKKSDFVAIQVWGKTGQDCFLIDKEKKRMGFVDTVAKIKEIIARHEDYTKILIEDKANGSAIIDSLRQSYRAVIPIEPYGSKESRAQAVSPLAEAGNVHIRSEHSSVIEEAVDFPNSDHDDEVDAMTQALNELRNVVAEIIPPKGEDDWDYDDQINDILSFR